MITYNEYQLDCINEQIDIYKDLDNKILGLYQMRRDLENDIRKGLTGDDDLPSDKEIMNILIRDNSKVTF